MDKIARQYRHLIDYCGSLVKARLNKTHSTVGDLHPLPKGAKVTYAIDGDNNLVISMRSRTALSSEAKGQLKAWLGYIFPAANIKRFNAQDHDASYLIKRDDVINHIQAESLVAIGGTYRDFVEEITVTNEEDKKHPVRSIKALLGIKLAEVDYAKDKAKGLTGDIDSYWFARIVNPKEVGPYFPPKALKNEEHYGILFEAASEQGFSLPLFGAGIAKVFNAMDEEGFRRIAFRTSGCFSLVFDTVPNKEGRQQLLMVTPDIDQRIPCPLVLPSLKTITIDNVDGKDPVFLRVMPELDICTLPEDTEPVVTKDEKRLNDLCRRCGLESPKQGTIKWGTITEIRDDNIGIYPWTDENGKKHRTPFILDWGAVHLPKGADLEKLKQQWATDPELKEWRDAVAHIEKQQVEHVIDAKKLFPLNESLTHGGTRKSRTFDALQEDGRYTSEIRAAAASTQKGGDPETYVKRVMDKLKKSPPGTLYPDR